MCCSILRDKLWWERGLAGGHANLVFAQTLITIRSERCRCLDALFRPSLIVEREYQVIPYDGITKCDVGIRRDLLSNALLSGATTILCRIDVRLTIEMIALAPAIEVKL